MGELGKLGWFNWVGVLCWLELACPLGPLEKDSKEHLKETSPIHHHSNNTGHSTTQHNFQIIRREGHNLASNIKESIFIRVNNPTLNRNNW